MLLKLSCEVFKRAGRGFSGSFACASASAIAAAAASSASAFDSIASCFACASASAFAAAASVSPAPPPRPPPRQPLCLACAPPAPPRLQEPPSPPPRRPFRAATSHALPPRAGSGAAGGEQAARRSVCDSFPDSSGRPESSSEGVVARNVIRGSALRRDRLGGVPVLARDLRWLRMARGDTSPFPSRRTFLELPRRPPPRSGAAVS